MVPKVVCFSVAARARIHWLGICCLLLAFACPLWAQTPTLDVEEQTILKLINDYRAQQGLTPLRVSLSLTRAADWMTADMAAKNYFSHTDSLGRDPFARMTAFGYNYPGLRGENAAAGYADAARTFNQWKTSPNHNTAMLNSGFNVIGISRSYSASSLYRWYWITDFGSYVDATLESGGETSQLVRSVNAASYQPSTAPDAIAAAFGNQLATSTTAATAFPLPLSLAGVTVTVNGIPASLLYVSPTQINYLVPINIDPGTAVVKVMTNSGVVATGSMSVENVSPSIFTFFASGKGTPAAQTTYDGVTYQSVAYTDGSIRPLNVGTASRPNYLVLYGTGLRRRSNMSNVRVTIGGVNAEVAFLGAHSRFAGLDQLNVKLPQEVRGRGVVDVVVTVDGRAANTVQISIAQ